MPRNVQAREKVLEAATNVIRSKGYSATTVDDLCAAAGVTKGAFFHHFKSKEELGVAAAHFWSERTSAFFASEAYHNLPDPLDRVLGYLDVRKSMLNRQVPEFTCLVGTMVQELYDASPDIREACRVSITEHAARIEVDIAEAIETYGITANWTARSLALYTQAVLQGAFILAKAHGDGEIAMACVDHLRRYVEQLFQKPLNEPVRRAR